MCVSMLFMRIWNYPNVCVHVLQEDLELPKCLFPCSVRSIEWQVEIGFHGKCRMIDEELGTGGMKGTQTERLQWIFDL